LYHVRNIQTNKVRRSRGRLKHVIKISKIPIKVIPLSTKEVLNQKLKMVVEENIGKFSILIQVMSQGLLNPNNDFGNSHKNV
jgi:hypothetical protein